jgi:uncharacterized protein involved in exopolysaccharide biosynthesis
MQDPDSSSPSQSPLAGGERGYYVLQEVLPGGGAGDDALDLRRTWRVMWQGRWIIASITALCTFAALAYALLATEWWRAEAVLAPADDKPMPAVAGQLGGLAALAGINIGGAGSSVDAIAVLRSRELAREFIEANDLLPVLFAKDWDPERKTWRSDNPRRQRDFRDGVKKFHKEVLRVSQDRQTKIVTVSVDWKDPEMAARWANDFVTRANERMRRRAVQRAGTNLEYLKVELAKTDVVVLQESIGRMMENEMQTLMLARGNEEYAFRVLDKPAVPKFRIRPKRLFVVVLGLLLGTMLGIAGAYAASLLRNALRPGPGAAASPVRSG